MSWKARQHRLNAFTDKYLKGVGDLREDGVPGPSTKQRINDCQFWCGWGREHIDGKWDDKLDQALGHPYDRKNTSTGTVVRGALRRKAHNLNYYTSHVTPGVTRFDGVPVAKCAVPILQWCRNHGWHGRLVSGWRSIPYSISLCYAMCGRPSCPGKCAGAATNHVGTTCQRFAVDVSDYATFRSVVAHCPVKPRIFNALPMDPVHFSPSGR